MREWLPGFSSAQSITADTQTCSWELEGRATCTADSSLPASQHPVYPSWSLAASQLPWTHQRHPSILEASGETPTSTTSFRSPWCSGEPSCPSTEQWRQVCEEGKPGSHLLASPQRTKSPSCWVLLQNKLRNSFYQVLIHQERQPQPCAKRVVSLSASDWHPKSYTPTCLYCWPNPQMSFICFVFFFFSLYSISNIKREQTIHLS